MSWFIHHQRSMIMFSILSIFVFSYSFMGGIPDPAYAKTKTVRKKVKTKNLNWDKKVGRHAYYKTLASMKRKGVKFNQDKKMVKRLNDILNRLKANALIPDLPYQVRYVHLPINNASCYPAGHILVYEGLFDKKKGLLNYHSDDEIAAVLAHEISHATLRHSYRSYKKQKALSIFGSVASIAVGSAVGGGWSHLFDVVYDTSTGIYFPSYGRKQELESDLEGLIMMMKSGFDPQAAIDVWDRAARRDSKEKTSIYSSHPSDMKRKDKLKKHLENIKNGRIKNFKMS